MGKLFSEEEEFDGEWYEESKKGQRTKSRGAGCGKAGRHPYRLPGG
jgi:hypothetical protein